MLLNGFVDPKGWLHWCQLADPARRVRKARPSELFVKKHLYSIVSAAGDKDPSIELGLAKLESDAVPVVQKIIDAARSGYCPDLSLEEKRLWYLFFAMQWRRTPETQQAVATDADILAMFDEAVARLHAALPERRDEIAALDTPEGRQRTLRNVRTETLATFGVDVLKILEQRGITILRITRPHKGFIIGSRAVVKLTVAGQSDLRNPTVELWLPIASDIAVGAGRGKGTITLLELADQNPIRQLNLAIASQSRIIAGASAALIRSLAFDR